MKKNLSVLLPAIVVVLFMLSLTGYAHGKHDGAATIKANIPLDNPLSVSAEDSQSRQGIHAETVIQNRRYHMVTSAKARETESVIPQDDGDQGITIFCYYCGCDLLVPTDFILGHLVNCGFGAGYSFHPTKPWCGGKIGSD
jgi:hypothetical protein